MLPSRRDLEELFVYDKCHGKLFWRSHRDKRVKNRLVGKIAGCLNTKGYPTIKLNGRRILVHKLIWFIENDYYAEELDHKNGDRADSRIHNLREVSRRQNCQNRKRHRSGGLVGATFRAALNKYQARIWLRGKAIHLGMYNTERQANKAYWRALKEYEVKK